MSSWKQDLNRGDQYDPVNKDGDEKEGNVFRLSRDHNGDYYLYRRGRYLSGILECGEYGTEEEDVICQVYWNVANMVRKKRALILKVARSYSVKLPKMRC